MKYGRNNDKTIDKCERESVVGFVKIAVMQVVFDVAGGGGVFLFLIFIFSPLQPGFNINTLKSLPNTSVAFFAGAVEIFK